jgi:class 3 adenylate cyclase/tetratricopeptide (TPR) repeat protein
VSSGLACPNCRKELPPDSAYCAYCGHQLLVRSDRATPTRPGWPPSERKYLSILFVDLQQSTALTAVMDPEEALSRLEPAIDAMRTSVRLYGGIVSKELGDGLIALFGAPESDANHAVMACRAALELTRRVAQLNDPGLQVRVGVHSGDVVVRVVAGDYSQIYEATGPALALASRLESAADPGEVLASDACRRLAEGLVSFEEAGRRPLRGFPHPAPTFRVTGFTGLSRWRVRAARGLARFIGRSSELASLQSAAEATGRGAGRIVSILGEPGIGKSRIVHEFLARLGGADWQVIEVECSPTYDAFPYATLKNLLLSLARAFGYAEFRIADYLGNHRSEFPELWSSAIDAILDRPIADPGWLGLGPSLRERAIIDAFCGLVERVAKNRRTLLLIEDLHWIDSASNVAIEALTSLTARFALLVLITSREEAAAEWLSRPGVTRLRLRPLPPAAATAFSDALLGESATLSDLKRRILDHTGRVPLFIEEVARRLVDTGTLVGDWGGLVLAKPIERLGVPPTVQGVIAGRIDRLAGREKSLLQAAAAVGPRTEITLLRAVTEMPEESMQRAIAALAAAELLIEISPRTCGFPHDLVREVAYDSLLGPERERLHRRILVAIATASEGSTEEAAEILTHHALLARAWAEASNYAHLAAQKCMTRSALHDAARYFEAAIDALDRSPASRLREQRAIDLRLEARQVIPAIGRVERWFQLAGEAETRAAAVGDVGRRVAALVDRAGALNFYSVPLQAIPVNETATRQAEALGVPGWLSIAEYGLGQACLTAGRYREAEQVLARAGGRLTEPGLEIPVGTTRPRLQVLCHMMKSIAHVALGEIDAAETWQARASEIAAVTKRPYDVIAADYGRGMFHLACGRFAAAFTAFDEARTLGRRHDIKQFTPVVTCQLGNLFLQQDDTTTAYDTLVEAKREAEELGHILSVLRASIYLGLALARRGRVAEALRSIRTAREQAVRDGFAGLSAEALVCEATVLASAEPPDRRASNQCLEEAVSLATRLEATPQVAAARALLGSNLAHQGDASAAIAELQAAADLFATMKLTRQRDRVRASLEKLLCVPTNFSLEGGKPWQGL